MTRTPKARTPDVMPPNRRTPKITLIREMLAAPEGVTLSALGTATGWQPHSVRAALSGLRKAGLTIDRLAKAEGESEARYRIAAAGGIGA